MSYIPCSKRRTIGSATASPWTMLAVVLAAMLMVASCSKGNSATGAFSIRGMQSEQPTSVESSDVPVILIATGATFELVVEDAEFWSRPAAEIQSAEIDRQEVATIQKQEGSTVTLFGRSPGTATLTVTARADGTTVTDTIELRVADPTFMTVRRACNQPMWAGLPAILRYRYGSEEGRPFGEGLTPFEVEGLEFSASQSNSREWVFETPSKPGQARFLPTLPDPRGEMKPIDLEIRAAPRIAGVKFLHVLTARVREYHTLEMRLDDFTLLRAVPVAEDGTVLCSAMVAGVATARTPETCSVEQTDSEGHFIVRSHKSGGCEIDFESSPDFVGLEGAALTATLSVSIIWASSFKSGGGSGSGAAGSD